MYWLKSLDTTECYLLSASRVAVPKAHLAIRDANVSLLIVRFLAS